MRTFGQTLRKYADTKKLMPYSEKSGPISRNLQSYLPNIDLSRKKVFSLAYQGLTV